LGAWARTPTGIVAAPLPATVGFWGSVVAAGVVVGGLAGLLGPLCLAVVTATITVVLLVARLDLVVPALIVASMLQATAFSVGVGGARLYPYQWVGIVGLLSLALAAGEGRIKLRFGLLELALVGYLAVNYVAIGASPAPGHALRVTLLLTVATAVYFLVANAVQRAEHFRLALQTLLVVGVLESLYAAFQLGAGALAYHVDVTLPVGFVGVRPEGRIGFAYGQPYGTFQEPGWLGAVLMFCTLVLAGLRLDAQGHRRKVHTPALLICCAGLFVSFSRGAWAGLIFGLLVLLWAGRRFAIPRRVLLSTLGVLVTLGALVAVALTTSEEIGSMLAASFVFDEGNSAMSLTNTRVLHMIYSFQLFLKEPILGHGPGNFGVQGFPVALPYAEYAEYEKIPFDPSIITTILGNTGLVGLGAFLLCVAAYLGLQRRSLRVREVRVRTTAIALFVGIAGLMFSYLVTTGFWMGFTWVFLGLSVGAARLTLESREKTPERQSADRD